MRWILDRKGGWIILTVIAIAIFIVVNVAAGRVVGMRADLTQDKLYSLSAGTQNILDKLQKPVELTLYYSDELGKAAPVYGNYEVRVKDLLRVIQSTSNGKVNLTVKDPKPFSEIEDKAVELGLQGVPVDDSGTKVYFGLSAKSGDKEMTIPFFQIEREKFLEYDVASLIFNLGTKGKPVVAVYTSRPMFGDLQMQMAGMPTHPYAVIQQLANHAEVKQIYDLADLWKDKPNVLMLVHPGNLSDKDYYNLDQYMLRGGKALIFLDPYNETAAMHRGQFPERVTSDMDRLLKHWGVEMVKDKVVGDRRYARMVNAGDDKRVIPAPYLTWMGVRNDTFSQTDAVTSQITLLNIESAGVLKQIKKEPKLTFEPLVETTPDSQEIDVSLLKGQKPQILTMIQNFKPSGKPLVVAARLSGTTTTMFPDGPPKEKKEEPAKDEKKDDGKTSDASKDAKPAATPTPAKAATDGKTPDAPANGTTPDKAVDKDTDKAGEKGMVKADVAERPAAPQVAQTETKPAGKPADAKAADEKPADAKGTETKPADAKAEDKKAEDKKADEKKDEAKKEPEEPKAPPFVKESTAPMNVILVADADMLEDRFWVQNRDFFGQRVQVPFANNSDFVVNAVENLAGGDDLIGLRSRGTAQRPFTKIAELKLAADEKYRAEEQRLQKKLEEAEKKLAELDKKKTEGAGEETVDKAVKATAAKFTDEVLTTRKALRKVQLALRENIESLERWLRFINIALIPILVGVLAVVLGLIRMRRRKHHGDAPAA